jgi:hypothetical protein
MLVAEALKAGFSLDQIKQARNELDSPSSSVSKVYSNHKQGSISERKIAKARLNHGKVLYHPLTDRLYVLSVVFLPRL